MKASFITLKKVFHLSSFGVVAIVLNACGSYPSTAFEDTNTNNYAQNTTQIKEVVKVQPPSDSYYKQYFNSKINDYDALEKGTVFTDIEAYSTTGSINKDGYIVEQQTKQEDSYGSWGENSKEITVNIYDHSPIVRWNIPYWWYGSGWGLYSNWCSPFWGIGYGWGYPFYGYYGWGYPFFYGGYYNNFYNPYYGNPYNGYAFTRGRSNTDYYNNPRTSLRSNRYSIRDASRGTSIARTKNLRASVNSITASPTSLRAARKVRNRYSNLPQAPYSDNYSRRSNQNNKNYNSRNSRKRINSNSSNSSNYNQRSTRNNTNNNVRSYRRTNTSRPSSTVRRAPTSSNSRRGG